MTGSNVARTCSRAPELPGEAELLELMEQGAAERYATDDRMRYIQSSDDDPGANRD